METNAGRHKYETILLTSMGKLELVRCGRDNTFVDGPTTTFTERLKALPTDRHSHLKLPVCLVNAARDAGFVEELLDDTRQFRLQQTSKK